MEKKGSEAAIIDLLQGAPVDLGDAAGKNMLGSWTRDENRQNAKIFNFSRDPETRRRMLTSIFSSRLTHQVIIDALGTFIPERLSDLEKFLLNDNESDLNFLARMAGKATILAHNIIAYSSPDAPCQDAGPRPRVKRAWTIPLENTKRIIIRKDNVLFIELSKMD